MKSKRDRNRSDTDVISIRSLQWKQRLNALSASSGKPVSKLLIECLERMLPILEEAERQAKLARDAEIEKSLNALMKASGSGVTYKFKPKTQAELNEGAP